MKKTKVGILGIGAIGSVIITGLYKNENLELRHFNRSKKEMAMVQFHDTFYSIPLNIQQDIFIPIKLDWLIICLKEHQLEDAKNLLQKLISRKTKIAIIRNGIELKKPLLPFAKENHILECMINCPTQPARDQVYQQLGFPIITTAVGDLANDFQQLFKNKDFQFRQVEDFKTENWKKLLESASLGAITCLTGETCWIFEDKKIRKLYQNLMTESIQVAKADGAIIPLDFVNIMLEKIKTYPKQKGTSMLTDRKLGRPIELGAKNGAIVRLGKIYKINTPLNDLVCTLLGKTNHI
ncbi:MAG: ketopantoate reductase family protein [Saprospiraceae bacterium]